MIRLLFLSISLCCLGCTPRPTTISVHELEIAAEPFDQWMNRDFTAVGPLPADSATADKNSDWTAWNTFWLSSAIGGQLSDVISSDAAINRGCREGNPLYGADPSMGVMALVKGGIIAVVYLVDEYLLDGNQQRQDFRNWAYGALAVTGFAAAGWNAAQDCE